MRIQTGKTSRSVVSANVRLLVALLMGLLFQACSLSTDVASSQQTCSASDTARIASRVSTGDGRGHGPDIGSNEWYSVVEFRLGLKDSSELPDRHTQQWCHFIMQQLDEG